MPKSYPQVEAFILAGGASSRMGRDKGLLDIAGIPLIVRMAHLVQPLVSSVTIVGETERYNALGLRAIPDQSVAGIGRGKPTAGPLVGIATALASTSAPWNLILACDLPYLTRDWLNWILERALASNAQILIPQTPGGLEPLAAVYRRECADAISRALDRGVRKVTEALADLRMETVNPEEWKTIDPDERVLRNMNSSADYEDARAWWEGLSALKKTSTRKRGRGAVPRRRKQ